ncbi:MAG: hypothetical protein K2P58_03065 [Hyphomonadaceae bacterium]|nr:hypothetical protein [Hyphomonadaceae bacterium]
MTVKPVEFCGSALADLRAFPDAARRAAGFQIDRVQRGRDPDDWKPMQSIARACGRYAYEQPMARSE